MLKLKVSLVIAAAALAGGSVIVACGDDKPAPQAQAPAGTPAAKVEAPVAKAPEAAPAAKAPEVALKAGAVTGIVKVKGEAPRRRKVKMDADPKCAALHSEAPLMD